jgi:hypothetical protein
MSGLMVTCGQPADADKGDDNAHAIDVTDAYLTWHDACRNQGFPAADILRVIVHGETVSAVVGRSGWAMKRFMAGLLGALDLFCHLQGWKPLDDEKKNKK